MINFEIRLSFFSPSLSSSFSSSHFSFFHPPNLRPFSSTLHSFILSFGAVVALVVVFLRQILFGYAMLDVHKMRSELNITMNTNISFKLFVNILLVAMVALGWECSVSMWNCISCVGCVWLSFFVSCHSCSCPCFFLFAFFLLIFNVCTSVGSIYFGRRYTLHGEICLIVHWAGE